MAEETPSAPSAPVSLRIGYLVAQWSSLAVFTGLSWLSPAYEKLFKEMGINDLPAPTELVIVVSQVVRSPWGTIGVILLGVVLTFLSLRGTLDQRLKKLIIGNVLWIALMSAFVPFALHFPVVQIQRALKDQQH